MILSINKNLIIQVPLGLHNYSPLLNFFPCFWKAIQRGFFFFFYRAQHHEDQDQNIPKFKHPINPLFKQSKQYDMTMIFLGKFKKSWIIYKVKESKTKSNSQPDAHTTVLLYGERFWPFTYYKKDLRNNSRWPCMSVKIQFYRIGKEALHIFFFSIIETKPSLKYRTIRYRQQRTNLLNSQHRYSLHTRYGRLT